MASDVRTESTASGSIVGYPKVNVIAHATDHYVDIVGQNCDVAVRAHSDPLPDSTLVQRTLAPAALGSSSQARHTSMPTTRRKRPRIFRNALRCS